MILEARPQELTRAYRGRSVIPMLLMGWRSLNYGPSGRDGRLWAIQENIHFHIEEY
jgi:hypothetical protein